MRIKIGIKLTAGFMLVILTIVALALYSVNISEKSLQESIGKSSIFLAEEIVNRIEQNIYLKVEQLQTHSGHSLLQKALSESNRDFEQLDNIEAYISQRDMEWASAPKDKITPFMKELINNDWSDDMREEFIQFYKERYGYNVYEILCVTNKYGANVAQTGRRSDYRLDDEEWWQVAREIGFYIGDVEYDERAETHGITIGVRVDDKEGNFIGVMEALISAKEIFREAEITTKKYETTEIKLITKNGKLIYATGLFKFMEDVSEKGFFNKIKGEKGFFTAKEGGKERLFSFAYSGGYRNYVEHGWIFVVGHDTDEVLKPAYILRNRMIIASLVLIATGILIAFFITRSITEPIAKLSKGVERIGKGDLEHRVELKTRDEIGELASSFTRMAENLKEAQERLIRSEKLAAIGQLASGVGHEIRNPLGVIGNSVYYLNMRLKYVDEKVKKHLDILKREVERSNMIVTDLLDFSRVKPPSLEDVDVNHIIKDAIAGVKLPENIVLETKLGEKLPRVLLDPDQVQRVFLNVISNALEAMPDGGRLEVNTGLEEGFIEISLKDTGEGVSEDHLQKIFEPLFTTKARGIGLGLATAKAIVESHKGNIEVKSKIGKGTTCTLKLPLKEKEK